MYIKDGLKANGWGVSIRYFMIAIWRGWSEVGGVGSREWGRAHVRFVQQGEETNHDDTI